jgi:hypothetical protein
MEFNLARTKNTAFTAPILANLPSAQQHQNRQVYVKIRILIRLHPDVKFWVPLCQFSRNCLVIRKNQTRKVHFHLEVTMWDKTYLAGSERKSYSQVLDNLCQ